MRANRNPKGPAAQIPAARPDLKQQVREKKLVAASSVGAAIFLTTIKIVIGVWTGSLGILAEAAHSALDLAAAVITFFAVRLSDRPADESHLYGHGKVENLSALAETGLLLLTCVWILYESVRRLFFVTVEVDPSLWAFLTMGLSIVIDFSRSRALSRVAGKYHSQALEADALHFSTDIWSSTVVIAGLALVWFGRRRGGESSVLERADAAAAFIVALIVIYVSMKLGRRAVDALLDRAPQGLADRLIAAVSLTSGVRRVSRTRLRSVGNQLFVDLTIEVPRSLSFEESHAVTWNVEEAVRNISPNADVVVHSEPATGGGGILEKIQAAAASERLAIHNITTHWTDSGIWIDLDLEVAPDLTFERAHALATDFEARIRETLSGPDSGAALACVTVHIEPRVEEMAAGREIHSSEADRYVETVCAVSREFEHAAGCRNIRLHEVKNGIYLSFCLLIKADRTIAEVHSIAEQVETRLRKEIPRLGRVVIHTEPQIEFRAQTP